MCVHTHMCVYVREISSVCVCVCVWEFVCVNVCLNAFVLGGKGFVCVHLLPFRPSEQQPVLAHRHGKRFPLCVLPHLSSPRTPHTPPISSPHTSPTTRSPYLP